MESSVQNDTYRRALWMIAAAAAFVLLYDSGHSYLSDEVWSLRTVNQPFPAMMKALRSDVHPPLYYLLLRVWRGVVGESEALVRLLSVLLCLAGGAFTWAAAKQTWGPRAGLMAAAVFAASPMVITAGQMARMYGLLVCASGASLYVFFRLMRSERMAPLHWTLYIVANIVGTFAQVWFCFLLLAQGIVYLVRFGRKDLAKMAVAAVLSVVPFGVLWLPVTMAQVRNSDAGMMLNWIQPPTPGDLLATVLYLGGVSVLALPLLFLKRPKEGLSWLVPAGLFAVTVVTPYVVSMWRPVYGQRFAIVALPAFALAFAALTPQKLSLGVESVQLGATCALAVAFAAFNQGNCDSRWTADYLSRTAKPEDLVIFTGMSRLPTDYYWDRLQPRRAVMERSFPGEIDEHPGFEGAIVHDARRRDQLRTEAAHVADQATAKGRVFLLHGFRPKTDEVLKSLLDRALPKADGLSKACTGSRNYFDSLTAYEGTGATVAASN